MKDFNLNEQSKKPMLRDSSGRMPVEVGLTLTYMPMEVQALTYVEKNQLSLNLWKESQADQD